MDDAADPTSLIVGPGDRFVAWGRCQRSPGGAVWFGPELPPSSDSTPWTVPPARSVPADGVRFDELERPNRRGALREGFGQLVGTWQRDRVRIISQTERDARTRDATLSHMEYGPPSAEAREVVAELRDHAAVWGLLQWPSGPSRVMVVELMRVTPDIAAWAGSHTPGLVVLRPWMRPDPS